MPNAAGMSSAANLLMGALVGVVVVTAFWLLAGLIDELRQ
jgi:hypothetical protein